MELTFATSLSNAIESLIAVFLLTLVRLFVKELRRLKVATRNALLLAGAGASLAYVLGRILRKLGEKQDSFMASADTGLRGFLEHDAYLVAMVGLVVDYGVSRVAAYSAEGPNPASPLRYQADVIEADRHNRRLGDAFLSEAERFKADLLVEGSCEPISVALYQRFGSPQWDPFSLRDSRASSA